MRCCCWNVKTENRFVYRRVFFANENKTKPKYNISSSFCEILERNLDWIWRNACKYHKIIEMMRIAIRTMMITRNFVKISHSRWVHTYSVKTIFRDWNCNFPYNFSRRRHVVFVMDIMHQVSASRCVEHAMHSCFRWRQRKNVQRICQIMMRIRAMTSHHTKMPEMLLCLQWIGFGPMVIMTETVTTLARTTMMLARIMPMNKMLLGLNEGPQQIQTVELAM